MNPPRARKPPPPKGWWATMAKRPTADLIVLGLTVVVALSVLAIVVALVWVKIARPEDDVSDLAKQVGGFISSLVGVIVGYIAGRGVGNDGPGKGEGGGMQ